MHYLYKGGCENLDVDQNDVLELMAAANFFQLDGLLRFCESRCSTLVDLDNIVSMYIHAKVRPLSRCWRLPYLHIQEFALIGSLVIVVLSCFNNGRSTTPSNCWNSARVSYCRTWSLCWLTTTQSAVWFSVRNCTITTSWPACCWRCRLALKAARSTKNKQENKEKIKSKKKKKHAKT